MFDSDDTDDSRHLISEVLDEADRAYERGAEADAWSLNDEELAEALSRAHALAAKQAELELRLVAEVDARDLGRRMGASSTPAWLRDVLRIRPRDARSAVDLANRLGTPEVTEDYAANPAAGGPARSVPATSAALAAGEISVEHALVVAKAVAEMPPDVAPHDITQGEADLAAFAREHDPAVLQRLATHLLHVLAGESLEDREERARRKRRLRLTDLGDGTVRVSGILAADDAAIVSTALDPLAAPNPSADGERDGRHASQRTADALVELCRRHLADGSLPTRQGHPTQLVLVADITTLTSPHGGGTTHRPDRSAPRDCRPDDRHPDRYPDRRPAHFGAGEDHSACLDDACDAHRPADAGGAKTPQETRTSQEAAETGVARPTGPHRRWFQDTWARRFGVAPAELSSAGPVSSGTLRRLTCDGSVTAVLVDDSGVPLRVGRTERSVTPGIFTALVVRDRGCTFPGCTRPPAWCHAHHMRHWADGGATDLENLVLVCGYHHRSIHHSGWEVQLGDDGQPEFIPPPWVDPDRHPRRNTRPRHERQSPPDDSPPAI